MIDRVYDVNTAHDGVPVMGELVREDRPAAPPGIWHMVTGEYPPDLGGVADYTAAVATALANTGAEVHVWSSGDEPDAVAVLSGVGVHRVAGGFGPAGLARMNRQLDGFAGPRTILIQYVPHAFGWKAMNIPFVAWALIRRVRRRDDVRVIFHEVTFPWVRRPLRNNVLAIVTQVMAAVLLRACTRAYVTVPGWVPRLRRLGAGRLPIVCTPVPANVPDEASTKAVAARRAELTLNDPTVKVACHFGTYGSSVTRDLGSVLRELLRRRPDLRVVLLGAGGDRWRDELAAGRADWHTRIIAPGALAAPLISEYLRACDLAIQPYPDGASGRRGTLMAALANGVPAVTTIGILSEPVWADGAVAAAAAGDVDGLTRLALDLFDRPERLAELGRAGRRLYQDHFALRHTLAALMDLP